ncbi:MAG: hypothetical protein ACR2GK_03000 [Gemmatimonadaceae bacterium]
MSRIFFTDRDLGKQFPEILRAAGISVESHGDHFRHDAADEHWLPEVGRRRWVVLTHDQRIRYKVNERTAVMQNEIAMFVVIGAVPYADLARTFIALYPRVEAFLNRNAPPFIARIYPPSPYERTRRANAKGRVEPWLFP